MKNSLIKFMIFEISSFRNLLYEFDRIVNVFMVYYLGFGSVRHV